MSNHPRPGSVLACWPGSQPQRWRWSAAARAPPARALRLLLPPRTLIELLLTTSISLHVCHRSCCVVQAYGAVMARELRKGGHSSSLATHPSSPFRSAGGMCCSPKPTHPAAAAMARMLAEQLALAPAQGGVASCDAIAKHQRTASCPFFSVPPEATSSPQPIKPCAPTSPTVPKPPLLAQQHSAPAALPSPPAAAAVYEQLQHAAGSERQAFCGTQGMALQLGPLQGRTATSNAGSMDSPMTINGGAQPLLAAIAANDANTAQQITSPFSAALMGLGPKRTCRSLSREFR